MPCGVRWGVEGPCTVRSNEQVWTGLQWWPPDVTSRDEGLGFGGRGSHVCRGPVQWGPMHGTYQHPPQQNDRQYYLPITSLTDGKTNSKNIGPCTLFLPPANLGHGNMFTGMCLSTGGDACSRGVPGGDPPRTATAAGGTYPTGMHSCNWI